MAEYSKQYLDIHDPDGMDPDFDIDEIASSLSSKQYASQICEGFGFIAIGKDKNGNVQVAMPTPESLVDGKPGATVNVDWKPIEEVIKSSKSNTNQ